MPTPLAQPLITDWIGSIASLVGGLSGLIAAGFAIASFVVAIRANGRAKTAVANDAETRQITAEAVELVAPAAAGIATLAGEGRLTAEGVVGPPNDIEYGEDGSVTVHAPSATMEVESRARLDALVRRLKEYPDE